MAQSSLVATAIRIVLVSVAAHGVIALELLGPTRPGPNPDFPPFTSERNGIYASPWGAAGYSWPEKMFWESVPEVDQKLSDMHEAARDIESRGLAPLMGAVAWGYEYTAATGGDPVRGLGDKSQSPGWKQWGEWAAPRKDKYFAKDWDGETIFKDAGYITPLMPLDSVDWPEGIRNATYGDWQGVKLGRLANKIQARGFFAADFIVGLYGGNYDFHQRVIDDFSIWSGVPVPAGTITERKDYLVRNAWPKWQDFKSHRMARMYARAANTIRESGREPLVGGQILPHASLCRHWGNDFRIYLQYLPAENWYFQVETHSDGDRPVPPYWTASTNMGGHAGRAPDFRFGAHLDAEQHEFWTAVLNANRKDSTWGRRYLKHSWLSVGWTHVATTNGSVRRAAQAFHRGYWDAGGVDTLIVNTIRRIVPKHPFGPALYYSTDLERQTEQNNNANLYYFFEPFGVTLRNRGAPVGYFVGDSALSKLDSVDYPSGWFVYQDVEGFASFSAEERRRLEKIAPVLSPSMLADSSPVSFQGDSLGGYGFIDQDGRVIVLVSNASDREVNGTIRFNKVENGTYRVEDILQQTEFPLTIAASHGGFALRIAGRDTRVFAIEGLRQAGRKHLIPWNGSAYTPPLVELPGVMRPSGTRLDALGRRSPRGPQIIWSVPDK